jgi:DNA-binding LytR/AlgR family response regulator
MTHTATALIAEDEPLLAEALRQDLLRLWPGLQVVAMAANGEQAVQQALQHRPRLAFLDIRMPGLSGLEAAQALAEEWPDDDDSPPFPLLVFVTAYDQYALDAFERQAVDYLLKPVQPERLALAVRRLQQRLAERDAAPAPQALQAAVAQLRGLLAPPASTTPQPWLEVLQVASGHTIHFVPVDEVLYVEAADKYLRVVTAGQEHVMRLALRELLPQLDPQRFWQVHRGTVVQVRCIERAQRDEAGKLSLSLRGRPERLAVSRLHAHRFKGL